MHGLTGFQRDLIYCIATIEDPYGQKIKHEVEANLPLDVKNGRLYPNLDKLVKKGLLKKKKKDERTNLYLLTPLAEEMIAERQRWEDEMLEAAGMSPITN